VHYVERFIGLLYIIVEIPIDSGIVLSITIDKLRVFINRTLSTESLINQLLIKRVGLSISIDSRKRVFFLVFFFFLRIFFPRFLVREDPILLSSADEYCCTYREDVRNRLPLCEG
jgi:hypothetical protein